MLPLLLGVHGRVRLPAQTLLAQPAPFRRSAHAHVLASKGEYTLTKEWATAAQLRNASEWYCFPGRTEQNAAGYEGLADPTHGYQSYDRGCEAREALVGEGAGGRAGGFSVRALREGPSSRPAAVDHGGRRHALSRCARLKERERLHLK